MFLVQVFGVPSNTNSLILFAMDKSLRHIVASVPELGIKPEHVRAVFIPDMGNDGRYPKEIMVSVRSLYEKPERTDAVLGELLKEIGGFLKRTHFKESLVECFLEPIEPVRCWSSAGQ